MTAAEERMLKDMVVRVAAGNDYSNWVKRHKPNLGPYHAGNPCYCVDCGKPRAAWVDGERCAADGTQDGQGAITDGPEQ